MQLARRHFLGFLATAAAGVLPSSCVFAAPLRGQRLEPQSDAGKIQRYTAAVEVQGTVRLNADGKKVTTAPLAVLANFEFDERVLAAQNDQPQRVLRHYTQAAADIRVNNRAVKNVLRDDTRLVALDRGAESISLYSPLGPLVRDELELLRFPGEPLVWNALLPADPVEVGGSWKILDFITAALLGIDVVTASELKATYAKQDGAVAKLELAGSVAGAVAGVVTDLVVNAKASFDTRQKQFTWLAISVEEKRAIGHAQPGFETTTRVRIAAANLASSGYLTDQALEGVPLEQQAGSTLLLHKSADGGFDLLHDRRWHVMTDHREATVLRLIDNGDLIAQCNIARLPDVPAGKQLSMDAYQQEVITAIGKNFSQVVTSDIAQTDSGLRQLRVVAAGTAEEIPVQWIYYHLADDQGRAIALVYTMAARLAERFTELDRSMVDSLTLRDRPTGATTPAQPVAKTK